MFLLPTMPQRSGYVNRLYTVNMIKDENGKVFVKYYDPTPKFVRVGEHEYVATVQHGVSMFLAEESDVPAIIATKGGCCGQQRLIFSLPNQESVNVWLTGNR